MKAWSDEQASEDLDTGEHPSGRDDYYAARWGWYVGKGRKKVPDVEGVTRLRLSGGRRALLPGMYRAHVRGLVRDAERAARAKRRTKKGKQ